MSSLYTCSGVWLGDEMYLLVAARAAEPPVLQVAFQHYQSSAEAAVVVLLALVLVLLHLWPPKPVLCLVNDVVCA